MTTGRRFFRPHLAFSASWRNRAPAGSDAAEPPLVPRDQADRFREVMLPHMDAAYNLARYLARDPSAAEDIVQDAFLRAFRSFHSWRGESAKAWLLAIVRNCFLNWANANRDSNALPAKDAEEDHADTVDDDTPEAILLRRDEAETVRATVGNLPEPFRETLVLRELEELSYKEIAMLTDVPIGTVMSRLARARQMLADLLLPGDEPGWRARP